MVQIDMEMPTTCWECPFGLPRLTGNHFVICMVPGCNRLMTAQDAKEKRAKNCPLIDTGEEFEWCHDCKEYDAERHCCPRWTKVIRNTVEELKQGRPKGKWIKPTGMMPPEHHGHYECSECGFWAMRDWAKPWKGVVLSKFCGGCGAEMLEAANDIH